MNEFLFIDDFLKKIALDHSLSNDAFVIDYLNGAVVTKDVLVEGVHFLHGTLGSLVGKKALRVNLSDIASMGASPLYYMLALVASKKNSDEWFKDLCMGLEEDSKSFGLHLVGGDTVFYDGPNILSITMFGGLAAVHQGLCRNGAKAGDLVCTTGTIGDSAVGLMICEGKMGFESAFLRSRYELPQPRIEIGNMILGYASACIDISDGLIQDAEHVCKGSGVGMSIKIDEIPISADVKHVLANDPSLIETVLNGGDDYELLFTISEDYYMGLRKKFDEVVTPVRVIGEVTEGSKVSIFNNSGEELYFSKKGFIHGG